MDNKTKGLKSNTRNRRIVIIGNGISGITCARNIRKQDSRAQITLVSGETPHFFSRTALMYVYMGHMKFKHTKPYEDFFWEKNRLNLIHDWVTKVNVTNKSITLKNHSSLNYDVLVLATGSKPNKFGWPGQNLAGVQGLYSYQDLQNMEKNTQNIKKAVIIGGGLIGIEMAEMLRSRNIHVIFLVREAHYWSNVLPREEGQLIERHIREHHIDLRLNTELKEITGNKDQSITGIVTNKGEEIPCEFVGLTAGVSPNIGFLKDSGIELSKGILINSCFETNIPDVYAIGDCAEFHNPPGKNRRKIEQVWYTGRMHGETLAYNLTHPQKVQYQPGMWFNSAKFLDIEFQTYGQTPPSNDTDDIQSFFWEDEGGKISLRLYYEKDSHTIVGINSFGFRLRHIFFEKAIPGKWSLIRVLKNLDRANFDPELYKNHRDNIIKAYNSVFDQKIKLSKKKFAFFQK